MTEWFRRINLVSLRQESADSSNAQELLAKLGRLMEPTEGAEQTVFSISQEDVIWAALFAGCDAETWLKTPAGWPKMRVKVSSLGGTTNVKVLNLGAESGIVYERGGFLVTIEEPINGSMPLSISYTRDKIYEHYGRSIVTDSYWTDVRRFIDRVDLRGRRFVEEICFRPERQKIEFVSTVLAKAFQCPLPQA